MYSMFFIIVNRSNIRMNLNIFFYKNRLLITDFLDKIKYYSFRQVYRPQGCVPARPEPAPGGHLRPAGQTAERCGGGGGTEAEGGQDTDTAEEIDQT